MVSREMAGEKLKETETEKKEGAPETCAWRPVLHSDVDKCSVGT